MPERVNNIKTKQDPGKFVDALRANFAAHPERWQYSTLDRFLEEMETWIEGMESYYYKKTGQPPADPPTWKTFGDILMYE